MKIEKGKLIKKILKICFYVIIIGCFLYNVMFSIHTTITKNEYFQLFGISFFKMNDDLMQDDINSGDLVIVREAKAQNLQEGDIIAYTVNGKTRINKIFKVKQDEYITKSNKNYNPDIEKITYDDVIGKMLGCVSSIGFIISILQSKITTGCILVFLILRLLCNKYLFAKKQERIRKKNG